MKLCILLPSVVSNNGKAGYHYEALISALLLVMM